MPPRKRAASAPKAEEHKRTAEAGAEPGGDAPAEPTATDGPDDEPARSDIQTGGEPCSTCFPGGWAAQHDSVSALGCEHGTWQRNPVN